MSAIASPAAPAAATTVAAIFLLLVPVAAARAQQIVWDANGSAVTQGLKPPATVTFTFVSPRGDFATQGAAAGQILLEIERDGASFAGIAYGFRPGCAPESYEISGSISADEKTLTLKGRAPVRDASCKVVSFADQTLLLKQGLAAAPVTQAPATPAAQAPRPISASEQCAARQSSAGVERYCASSVLPPQAGNIYQVQNLFSGNTAQAWIEGQVGQGIGEWVEVEFAAPRRVTGLAIDNGYQKSPDIFVKNSRVRSIEVRFSQGHSETFTLADRFGTQVVNFATPTVTSWVQIVIRDVYPGIKYTDTAISKLYVQSTAAN